METYFLSSIQIFDKLCQSFGGDVLQALFNSSEGLANCSSENMRFWILRFISDQVLAMAFSNILFLDFFYFFYLFIFVFGLTMAWIYFPEKEKSTDMLSFLFGSLTICSSSFFHFISSGNYFINLYRCSQ
jgi:hypothetical protein